MSLLDTIRQKNPSLRDRSDDELKSIIRKSPEFTTFSDEQFDRFVSGAPEQEQEDEGSPGFTGGLSAGVDQIQAMGGGLLQAAGDAVESDTLYDAGKDIYDSNMEEAAENDLGYGFTDIRGPGDAWNWARYTAGNLLPTLATSVAGGGVGGLAGRALAGAAAKQAATKAGQGVGAMTASTGMETGMIMGETQDLDVSLAHGSLAGAMDALLPFQLLRKAGAGDVADKAADEISENVLRDLRARAGQSTGGAAGTGSLTGMLTEMPTEGLQGLIGQHANYWVENNGESLLANLGEADWKAVIDEAAAGGLMGGVVGAPTGVAERGQARSQVERIEAAREAAAAAGGDPLDQVLASQAAERESVEEEPLVEPSEAGQGPDQLMPDDDLPPPGLREFDREQPNDDGTTGYAADDLSPFQRNQLRDYGLTDDQLWNMPTNEALAQLDMANRQRQEPQSDDLTEQGTGVYRVPVDQIQVDPQQYQFRSRVNQDGVDSRLDGVTKWDDNRAGDLLLHRRNDGSLFAADGHHRLDLARRLGQPSVNARILEESEGMDVPAARVEAAMANIADGKAEPLDVAKVFRDVDAPNSAVRERFNLPNNQVSMDGEALANLSDNAFGMVAAGQMSEKDGAAIGASFEDPAQQEAAVRAFQNATPKTAFERQLLVNEIRAAGFAETQGDQGGLFGDDPAEISLLQKRLSVLDSLRQALTFDKKLFGSLNKNAGRAGEAGNQIATEANKEITRESASALDLINRVSTTPALNEMVNRAARRLVDGEKKATVVRDLKAELRAYEQGNNQPTVSGQGGDGSTPVSGEQSPQGQGLESERGERLPENDPAGSDQGGQPQVAGEEVAPSLELEPQTEDSLESRARAQADDLIKRGREQREVEQRALADDQVGDFTLTGSDSPIDEAEARGQGNMFDEPAPSQESGPESAQSDQQAAPRQKPEVSDNTIVTDDAADAARAILKAKLGQMNTGLDPEMYQAGITLTLYHIEKGARTFSAYAKAMVADLGDVAKPYLKQWYMGAKLDPRATGMEGLDRGNLVEDADIDEVLATDDAGQSAGGENQTTEGNDDVSGSDSDLESDSSDADTGNPMGSAPVPDGRRDDGAELGGSGREADEGGQLGQGGSGVSGGGAVTRGEQSDQPVYSGNGEFEPARSAAGADNRNGSGAPDGQRVRPERPASTEIADVTEAARARNRSVEDRRKAQSEAESLPTKIGDAANIADTLPMLLPDQQGDVAFFEQRLQVDDKHGVLATNGTGTGKTFSGLGLVKRYARQGKDNIIVVVPNDKIASDWVKSAEALKLGITPLRDTQDNGEGVVVTTYANFRDNASLIKRPWDLLVFDESHYLRQKDDFSTTKAEDMRNALTGHPRGRYAFHQLKHQDEYQQLSELTDQIEQAKKADRSTERLQSRVDRMRRVLDEARKREEAERAQVWEQNRTSTLMLSATPFPYRKSVDSAEGYLFDYGQADESGRSYNRGNEQEQFFMANFGYRMRYNKLTAPESGVDTNLMEREFANRLMKEGAMRSRMLEVDQDYDRRFYKVESEVGAKIDEGLLWLSDQANKITDEDLKRGFQDLSSRISKRFDYLSRAYFLEAVKAKELTPIIRQHIEMGRKVVVFHDYNKGGGFHPFVDSVLDDYSGNDDAEMQAMAQAYQIFKTERKDLFDLDLKGLNSPRVRLANEFPNALFISGRVPKGERRKNADLFNDDDSGKNLIVVQSDAGREGISLHDTTGKQQRVLINLGLPVKPIASIQTEGRIYRTFVQSDAIQRYASTGLSMERWAVAQKLAARSGTAENLAMGNQARGLKDAILEAYEMADEYPPGHDGEGKGGKERDRALVTSLTDFDRAKTYYFGTAKNGRKRSERQGADYYATPEPLGQKMVEWAGLQLGDRVLEPSAGHGAILRWVPENMDVHFVEPATDLASKAQMNASHATYHNGNFEDLNLVNKYSAIVMNPPYGSGGATAWQHIAKAARHLQEGGRIVALVPQGPAADKAQARYLESEAAKQIFTAGEITMPSVTFERAGSNVRTKVVILERHSNPEAAPQPFNRSLEGAETVTEFFNDLEGMTVPERTISQPATAPADSQESDAPRLETAETTHAKKDIPLYVAKVVNRIEDYEDFKRLRGIAKDNGGYYSKFSRNGAIPGFQFESEQERAAFLEQAAPVMEEVAQKQGGETRFSRTSYRRTTGAVPLGMSKAEVEALVDGYMANWKGRPEVVAENSIAAFPKDLRDEIREAGAAGDMRAVLFGGKIYILAPRIPNPEALQEAILHETIGHYGVRKMLGRSIAPALERVYMAMAGTEKAREIKEIYFPNDSFDASNKIHRLTLADELIAHMAETGKHERVLSRVVAAIRDGLRRMGFTLEFTEADVLGLLQGAQRTVENGGFSRPSSADVRFSRTGDDSADDLPLPGIEVEETTNEAEVARIFEEYESRRASQSGQRQGGQDRRSAIGGRQSAPGWESETQVRGRGDSGSQPAVIFRGSKTGLKPEDFNEDRFGFSTGHPSSGMGVFFTSKRGDAETYGNAEAFHLDMRNPYVLDQADLPGFDSSAEATRYRNAIKDAGYDGIIVDYNDIGGGFHYIPFEPEQVIPAEKKGDSRYRRGGKANTQALSESISKAISSVPELAGTQVIGSADQLPAKAKAEMQRQGVAPSTVKGLYVDGELYVVAGNIGSLQEGIETAVHEAVGHKGIRGVLGKDLDNAMLRLYRSLPNSPEGRAALAEVKRDYPFLDTGKREDRIEIAEEMVAHLLEKGHRPKAWQRAVSKIRELLRKLIPSVAWTYTDVLALGEQSREHLRARKAGTGDEAMRYHLGAKERISGGNLFDDFNAADKAAAAKMGPRSAPRRVMDAWKEATNNAGLKIRQGMVDRLAAFKAMDEQLLGERMLNEDITRSSWVLGRMANAANGALHSMLHTGRLMLDPDQKVLTLKDDDSKGLGSVFAQLASHDDPDSASAEVQRFMGWIAGNRARKLLDEGRENLFTEEEISAMESWDRGALPDGRNRAETYQQVFEEFQAYRDDVLAIADQAGLLRKGMDPDDATVFMAEKHGIRGDLVKRIKKARKDAKRADDVEAKEMAEEREGAALGELQEALATDLGIAEYDAEYDQLTTDQRELWANEFYVPFYRISEEEQKPTGQLSTNGLSRQQAYKRLKGGQQNLNDLLENTMMNFHHLLDASLKNQAAQQAVENAQLLGMARRVPAGNRNTKTSTFIMEEGEQAFYQIDDPMVFEALTALSTAGMNNMAMKVMRGFKRLFTNMTTTTPQFMVANLIRDSLQASATSEVSKNAFANVIGGTKSYRDLKLRAQMMASGASFNFGHLYGNNPDELRAQLTRDMRGAKLIDGPQAVPDALRNGWAWWNDVNNAAENVNRAAIFTQNQDQGRLKAAFESRDLIDFSAHGAWPAIRILIDIVPFLNARIQGLDKIYRSGMKPGVNVLKSVFGGDEANVSDKQAAGRFWSVTGALALATMALYLHNEDDEEYQKLEDWQKDTYWFIRFGDQAYFIPKPFEVGAIATMVERITQQFVDDEATGKVFRERMYHMVTDTFAFSPVPQAVQPVLDVYANYDAFTQRPIESMGMERLSPELRKRASTSKAGEWISQGLNSTLGALGNQETNPFALSPVQVDHLIGGYLGQVGSWVAGSGDVAWRVATGKEAPAQRWYEYQPIRRFYSNLGDEDRYTRYGTVFYEGLREAGRAYADVKELREMGRLADATELAEDRQKLLQLRLPLNRAQSRLREINRRIDTVRKSNLDGELKRQQIDRMRAIKNQIQRALGERVIEARAE